MDLESIYRLYPDEDSCLSMLERVRWKGKPTCPYCNVQSSCPMRKERRHHCNNCGRSFSVGVNTVFHRSKVDLRRWLFAIWLYTDPRRSVAVRELAEAIGVNRNTAWQMMMKMKVGLVEQEPMLQGVIQVLLDHRNGGGE